MGPSCPYCKARVPFRKTQWNLGKPFECQSCHQQLIMPKALSALGLGLFVAFWNLREAADGPAQTALLILVVMIVGLALTWTLADAKPAPQKE